MKKFWKKFRRWWKKFQQDFRAEVRDPLKNELERLERALSEASEVLQDEVLQAVTGLALALYRAQLLRLMGKEQDAKEEVKQAFRTFRSHRNEWISFLKEILSSLRQ